jgi:coenzyme F420-0:L-glutamate ligase
MNIKTIRTRVFEEDENLAEFVYRYIKTLKEDTVLVVTSKIVALAEGRTAVIKNSKTKEQLIRAESQVALPTATGFWLTIKDGAVMASAGIDESNAKGKLILLPKDSFQAAQRLRQSLQKHYKVKNLGVIITDSRVIPLRTGVSGVALGYAGFKGLRDYRGTPDIFGRKSKHTRANVADTLAAAAVLLMGEGAEQLPLAVITGAPVEFQDKVKRKELLIDLAGDLYQPLMAKLPKLGKS